MPDDKKDEKKAGELATGTVKVSFEGEDESVTTEQFAKDENLTPESESEAAGEKKEEEEAATSEDEKKAEAEKKTEGEKKAEGEVESESEKKEEADKKKKEEESEPEVDLEGLPKDLPKGVEKRFATLTRNWRGTQRELAEKKAEFIKVELDRDAWRKEALKKDGVTTEAETAEAEKDKSKPDLSDLKEPKEDEFDDYAEYLDKKHDFNLEKQKRELTADFDSKIEEVKKAQAQAATAPADAAIQKKVDAAKQKYPDFEEVAVNQDLFVTPLMLNVIQDSPYMGDLAYHMGSHPEDAKRISGLNEEGQVRELITLVDKFKKEVEGSTKKEEPATGDEQKIKDSESKSKQESSNAPEPPHLLDTSGDGGTTKRPEDMSMDEYRAWRQLKAQ